MIWWGSLFDVLTEKIHLPVSGNKYYVNPPDSSGLLRPFVFFALVVGREGAYETDINYLDLYPYAGSRGIQIEPNVWV